MVKFSRQFEAQLVPEWKEAFVDYGRLKEDVKKMAHAAAIDSTKNSSEITSQNQKQHSSSFFSATISSAVRRLSMLGHKHREHGPIQVHRKLASSTSKGGGELYQTELFEQFADVEAAADFFSHLDLQLNKVNQFYKAKEKEFVDRGESLKKQMDILVELKELVNQHHREKAADHQSTDHNSYDDPSISCHIKCDEDDAEKTEENGKEEKKDGNDTEERENDGMQSTNSIGESNNSCKRGLSGPFLKNNSGKKNSLRLKIPLTIPSKTFSAISYLVGDDQLVNQFINPSKKFGDNPRGTKLHVNKAKLHHAEKMIRGASIELYKGLSYLKTFRNLNMLAFIKILKKFDKVTNKEVMPIYLRVVESSYFNSSDKVLRLSDEVEALFIKHFAADDRRKAMKYLKPNHRKESHAVTFFIGLFAGCFLALLAGYVIMAHITGMYTHRPSDTVYMETVYPVLSMFSLLFLHFFLYGCNIFMWRRSRINYSFIFELAQTKELKYREVFLICAGSMTVIIGVLFIHLSLMAKGYSSIQVQAIPGFLLLFFLLLLICPFNIIYKSSRQRFLCVIRNIVFSPLYKVAMLDFFMADQLCSQVPLLRNLESVACYYITGSYKTQDYGYCMRTTHYRDFAYAVSFLPYYWRAMQCARRWFDEGQSSHLVNLGKYVSAMLAAGAKVAYDKEKSIGYLCMVVALSSAATVYQLYWDYVKDWGLLQFNSKNPWLRNELMVKKKSIYYFSMVLNLILRLAWLQTVLHPNFGNIDYRVMGLFLAALEVIRRGQWNFYRLENEHLNNAGKFRAVKTVPLPFHEVGEED